MQVQKERAELPQRFRVPEIQVNRSTAAALAAFATVLTLSPEERLTNIRSGEAIPAELRRSAATITWSEDLPKKA